MERVWVNFNVWALTAPLTIEKTERLWIVRMRLISSNIWNPSGSSTKLLDVAKSVTIKGSASKDLVHTTFKFSILIKYTNIRYNKYAKLKEGQLNAKQVDQ